MIPKNSIHAVLDAVALQQREGKTSLIVTIEPDLIEEVRNALRGYRKLFAPLVPGMTDPAPIYAAYEQMKVRVTPQTVLVFVECRNTGEFREALGRMPIRKSSEWRSFDDGNWGFVL